MVDYEEHGEERNGVETASSEAREGGSPLVSFGEPHVWSRVGGADTDDDDEKSEASSINTILRWVVGMPAVRNALL